MSKKVLVAYASVSGSTGEVAETIADVLATHTAVIEVAHVRDVISLIGIDAVVLGSSIRAGRWLPEAQRFLANHFEILERLPVAYFTTCLTLVNDTEGSRQAVMNYMQPVLELAPKVEPIGIGLFAGSLDHTRQRMYALSSPLSPQGDYRNWEAIKSWAAEIADQLLSTSGAAVTPVIHRDPQLGYVNMPGSDLANINWQGADLTEAQLHQANLQGANLEAADLQNANLEKADLNEAFLQDASLSWAGLSMAELRHADMQNANLIGTDLQGADMHQANLSHATLNGANLSQANLSGALLRFADLNWANLSHTDLKNADLSGANLGWADFSEADLAQVTLHKARYNHFTTWPEGFSAEQHGAILINFGL